MGLFDGTPLERPVLCDRCSLPESDCKCPPLVPPDVAPEKQRLKIRKENRKRGKTVTVISGFSCRKEQLQSVLTKLKNHCGAGGTIAEANVELQGDHCERASAYVSTLGYKLAR